MVDLSRQDTLAALASALGEQHVLGDEDHRARWERGTFAHASRVTAVVRPGTTEDVQAIVRIAAEHGTAIHPISRGRNWGYGSRAPTADALVVDLSRMNRILQYDPELAYVRIEPGVTQQQLVDFLAEHGGRFWADTTSVAPDSSVVGNILERGHGLTPYADHVDCVGDFDVVLGDGRVLSTGHGRFGATATAPLDRYGAGPSLSGLFSQSSFGIVTAASVWLMPTPESSRAFIFDAQTDEEFFALLPAVRALRLQGTLRSGPRFANVFRGLMFGDFPWDRVPEGGVLSKELALELAAELGRGAWRGCCAVHGTAQEVEAAARTIRAALEPRLSRPLTVFDPRAPEGHGAPGDNLGALSTLLTGGLTPGGVASVRTYWRKRNRPTGLPDPDRDRCGVMWLAPVTPFRSEDFARVAGWVEEILPRHGFEPDVSAYCLRARTLHFHISIIYDRDRPGADDAAKAAHDELLGRCLDAGYPPHRLGLQSMHAMDRVDEVHRGVLGRLKQAFDPAGILSPRRYHPKRTP